MRSIVACKHQLQALAGLRCGIILDNRLQSSLSLKSTADLLAPAKRIFYVHVCEKLAPVT